MSSFILIKRVGGAAEAARARELWQMDIVTPPQGRGQRAVLTGSLRLCSRQNRITTFQLAAYTVIDCAGVRVLGGVSQSVVAGGYYIFGLTPVLVLLQCIGFRCVDRIVFLHVEQ